MDYHPNTQNPRPSTTLSRVEPAFINQDADTNLTIAELRNDYSLLPEQRAIYVRDVVAGARKAFDLNHYENNAPFNASICEGSDLGCLALVGGGMAAVAAGPGFVAGTAARQLAGSAARSVFRRLTGSGSAKEAESPRSTGTDEAQAPPGYDAETWQLREASRNLAEEHWWDPQGGEWRFHGADKWHEPHWDFNPWTDWNSPWEHIDVESEP
jgi:hypothetical protein